MKPMYSNQAFFSINCHSPVCEEPIKVFKRVALEHGFRPVFYQGLKVRSSNLDAEIRADFYASRVIALYFGPMPLGSDFCDNWALAEIEYTIRMNKNCLVYATRDASTEVLQQHQLHAITKRIIDDADFERKLSADFGAIELADDERSAC